jgi:translation initiation factor 3 subunit B
MAPSFDQLSDHDLEPEEDEIDFSDLQEKYNVHLEQGLDTFVVSHNDGKHLKGPR